MLDRNTEILIVGLGLMGGSYARALTAAGYCVDAIDRDPEAIRYALAEGIIRAGATDADPALIGRADLVVFALYPHVFLSWLEAHQGLLKPGALLTDVTGVKGAVVKAVQAGLRSDVEFIAAHPMAGREVSGVQNSTPDIFHGANYIVVPTEKNTQGAIETCRTLGEVLGFARVSELTPEEHDEIIGFVSQLTHCIAVALMTCKESRHLVDYTGDSFRDLTRIAKINENMWTELFLWNREELLSQMDLFIAHFAKLRDALAQGDEETMKSMMRLSTERRRYFDKKPD